MNGTLTTLRQKTLVFSLAPDHNITIPSLTATIDGVPKKTRPIAIRITAGKAQAASGTAYQLHMLASRKSVYVGEPFVVQVVFHEPRNSSVAQAQYVAPKFDGFFVKTSPKERLENRPEGTDHVFDYILTPQREGNITITAPQIKLGMQTFSGAQDPWGFFNNEVHWQSLRGTPLTIAVKPLPTSTNLVGNFTVKGVVDSRTVHANKPVNYTLTLQGQGSLSELDDPHFDLNDVTVYSDDATSETRVEHGKIISKWVKKYTFISDHDFVIPAQTFTVFDPKSGQTKTCATQAVHVTVKGAAPATTASAKAAPSRTKTSVRAPQPSPWTRPVPMASRHTKDSNASLFEDTAYYARLSQVVSDKKWPLWSLFLSFLGGIIFACIGWKLYRLLPEKTGSRSKKYTPAEALEILYPHTHDTPEIEAMVRQLYRVQNGEKNVPIDPNALQRLVRSVV